MVEIYKKIMINKNKSIKESNLNKKYYTRSLLNQGNLMAFPNYF